MHIMISWNVPLTVVSQPLLCAATTIDLRLKSCNTYPKTAAVLCQHKIMLRKSIFALLMLALQLLPTQAALVDSPTITRKLNQAYGTALSAASNKLSVTEDGKPSTGHPRRLLQSLPVYGNWYGLRYGSWPGNPQIVTAADNPWTLLMHVASSTTCAMVHAHMTLTVAVMHRLKHVWTLLTFLRYTRLLLILLIEDRLKQQGLLSKSILRQYWR